MYLRYLDPQIHRFETKPTKDVCHLRFVSTLHRMHAKDFFRYITFCIPSNAIPSVA
jgi:hypothetical protein